ncbi:MAG: hypothetical protein DWH91_17035 [Planctomycetota bacterium]|nr:MAG: hypothetical protein DWH91_17035 [Planctomycetota bacterium]
MQTRRLLFHGLESYGWIAALVVALGVAITCVVLLFRYEQKLIERKLGYTLLALRLSVLTVLGVLLLEPVLAWTLDLERSGRIVVAIDVSQSMEAIDEQASATEKLRAAQALGLLPREAPVDEWGPLLDQKKDPVWANAADEPDATRRQALIDSRRETAVTAMAEIDKLERLEIARRLLKTGESPLIKELSKLGQLELCLFAGQASILDEETLDRPLEPSGDAFKWSRTDLMQVLSAAPAERGGLKLAGVVLLTDGRDNAHSNDAEYVKRFAGGAPIYPVLIGSERRPKDLAIGHVDAPPTVFQNDKPVIKAAIRSTGFDGQEITVFLDQIDADGQVIGEPQTRTITAKGPSQEVQFELTADKEGRQRYRLRTDIQDQETREDNNMREIAMQVVDDRSDILLIEGEGRWEFRYLQAALSRDERVQLDAVVFNQPFLGLLPDTFFPRELSTKGLNAQSKSTPFENYDMVVVGDVSPSDMPNALWNQLSRYVHEEGGTLILTAGRNYFPMAYNDITVDELLPVTGFRQSELIDATQRRRPQERGHRLALTPDGERQTMLQFSANEEENRKIWNELPGHPWALIGEAKPGASVWASLKSQQADPGLAWERQNALLVQQYLGTGQVVWIGIDSTWRFRFRVGDTYHHRFWGQMSRWAAELKAAAGNEFVRVSLERPIITEGEDAVVTARWDAGALEKFPNMKARAVLKLGGLDSKHPGVTVELKPDLDRPLIQIGRAVGLRPGDYSVKLEVENGDIGPNPILAELTVLENLSAELADVSGNRPLLEQLAKTTGGQYFPIHEAANVVKQFQDVKENLTQRHEVPLWNNWLVFLVFCGLLMTEWVLRKINGLP